MRATSTRPRIIFIPPNTTKYWNGISFETGIEPSERVTEGDEISVKRQICYGEAEPNYFSAELFCIPDEKSYALTTLNLEDVKDWKAVYGSFFKIAGRGGQVLNVRLRPPRETVRDLSPGMVIWKDSEVGKADALSVFA